MAGILDIVRATPKNNCGECGFPTCMAFAAAVAAGQARPGLCAYLSRDFTGPGEETAGGGRPCSSDTILLKELKAKVRGADLSARAEGLGAVAELREDGEAVLVLTYLGDEIRISANHIEKVRGGELDPRDQILLYNYLFFGGKGALSGEWIGLESLPNSVSKVVTLRRYAEERLAAAFEERAKDLEAACRELGAETAQPCQADACLMVPVLPKVPILIYFWDADRAEGFPARVKVVFDRRVNDFLDIESIVFCAERMTETLVEAM
jgi:hypothetical protein